MCTHTKENSTRYLDVVLCDGTHFAMLAGLTACEYADRVNASLDTYIDPRP